jgi:LacI family transcriptional regulator
MRRPHKLAILYPASVPWFARCLDGIQRYAREHGEWHFVSSPPTLSGAEESALTVRNIKGWKGDAMIVATNDPRELRAAAKMGIPVVNFAGGQRDSFGIPRAMVNHFQAGSMAAAHLLDRGLRNLAFFGWSRLWYSEQRRQGFFERAAADGIKCASFLRPAAEDSQMSWPTRIAGPAKWLLSLPRPCGIFAVHDYRAQFLIEICAESGLRIPEDIALIGMDNDETICEHSSPTLTSVSRNSERIGWEAMALLDRMLQGERRVDDVVIEPDRIVARQSTDRQYCSDPLVQSAVDFVRENLSARVNIARIAERLGISKRTLEMRFRESVGTSPHEFFTKLRVLHAQTLLQMPKKRTIQQIAVECGFGTAATVHATFRRLAGQSPARFRNQHARHASKNLKPM